MSKDINWLIEQWGIWSRQDGTGKLSCTNSPMLEGLAPASAGGCIMIADDTAMEIDSAISELKIRRPKCWEVLVMRNYYLCTTGTVAKRIQHSRPKVQELESAGAAFVEGMLLNKI